MDLADKRVVILCGPSGSGKTEWANKNSYHEIDDHRLLMTGEIMAALKHHDRVALSICEDREILRLVKRLASTRIHVRVMKFTHGFTVNQMFRIPGTSEVYDRDFTGKYFGMAHATGVLFIGNDRVVITGSPGEFPLGTTFHWGVGSTFTTSPPGTEQPSESPKPEPVADAASAVPAECGDRGTAMRWPDDDNNGAFLAACTAVDAILPNGSISDVNRLQDTLRGKGYGIQKLPSSPPPVTTPAVKPVAAIWAQNNGTKQWQSELVPECCEHVEYGVKVAARCPPPPYDGFYYARFIDDPREWKLAFYQNLSNVSESCLMVAPRPWGIPGAFNSGRPNWRNRSECLEWTDAVMGRVDHADYADCGSMLMPKPELVEIVMQAEVKQQTPAVKR